MHFKRSHGHLRHRHDRSINLGEDSGVDAGDAILKPPKRVVTVYETETPEGWTGGMLTTYFPSTSTVVVHVTTTANTEVEEETTTAQTTSRTTSEGTSDKTTATSSEDSASSSILPTAIIVSTASESDVGTTLAIATSSPSLSSTDSATSTRSSTTIGSATATAATVTPSASSSSNSGSGDAGTKAGIAIGILAGLLVVLALVYFAITKRRKQVEQQRLDDEKQNGALENNAPVTRTKAPRLSLRPVTQLFTSFPNPADKRASKAPAIAMVASPTMKRAPGASPWERPVTSDSENVQNPFGNHAENILEDPRAAKLPTSPIMMTPISEVSTKVSSPTFAAGLSPAPQASVITTDSAASASELANSPPRGPPVNATAAPLPVSPMVQATNLPAAAEPAASENAPISAVDAGATALAGPQRKQSVRKNNVPAPLDLTLPPKLVTVPPSPAGTEFSIHEAESGQTPTQPSASAAVIAVAGGPTNSTVHRVQLDFKPTMDDEMELQAGQIVRLLHEYDDGWALCIRLDRSEQGVVPRTCLSTRPVKPRPPQQKDARGPPVNTQGRARGPSVSSQRGPGPSYPPGPPGNRPVGRPGGPPPHLMGPAGQRGPGPARPMGPGGRPGPRPIGPQMGPGPRPQSPGGRRPQSPAGQRPQSPGPQNRPRSPSGTNRLHSPPGPSNMSHEYRPSLEGPPQGPQASPTQGIQQQPVTRKPVPGQAY